MNILINLLLAEIFPYNIMIEFHALSYSIISSFISCILRTFYKGSFQLCFISQVELIDPAVKGTLNVLRSCAKVPSIRRVVVTSSMASVAFTGQTLTPDVVVDETWFSDPTVCEKLKVCVFALFFGCCLLCKFSFFQLLHAKNLAIKG